MRPPFGAIVKDRLGGRHVHHGDTEAAQPALVAVGLMHDRQAAHRRLGGRKQAVKAREAIGELLRPFAWPTQNAHQRDDRDDIRRIQ